MKRYIRDTYKFIITGYNPKSMFVVGNKNNPKIWVASTNVIIRGTILQDFINELNIK